MSTTNTRKAKYEDNLPMSSVRFRVQSITLVWFGSGNPGGFYRRFHALDLVDLFGMLHCPLMQYSSASFVELSILGGKSRAVQLSLSPVTGPKKLDPRFFIADFYMTHHVKYHTACVVRSHSLVSPTAPYVRTRALDSDCSAYQVYLPSSRFLSQNRQFND